jgi:hypothetical protein
MRRLARESAYPVTALLAGVLLIGGAVVSLWGGTPFLLGTLVLVIGLGFVVWGVRRI